MLFITLLSFVAVIAPVVAVHEFGHYLAARFFGVRVLRFSVGFGKPLACKTDSAGTEWAFAPILLGGYVRLLDADTAAANNFPAKETMESQNNWRRFVIYAAGPLANIVLAAVILTGVLMAGETGLASRVGEVRADSPAAEAGVAAGDRILRINGAETPLWRQVLVAAADAALDGGEMVLDTDNGRRTVAAGALKAADVQEDILDALGVYPDTRYITQTVESVAADSAAARAGILPGDVIAAVGGAVPETWRETAAAIAARPGLRTTLVLWRNEESVTVAADIATRERGGKKIGLLGITPKVERDLLPEFTATLHYNLFSAAASAAEKTVGGLFRTFQFLGHIVGGNLSFEQNISGPVGIARASGAAAQAGFAAWWSFAALISISLAAVNLLPLPILDGGQMVVCVVQAVLRRPLSQKLLANIDRVGVTLLLFLMVAALGADLAKLF